MLEDNAAPADSLDLNAPVWVLEEPDTKRLFCVHPDSAESQPYAACFTDRDIALSVIHARPLAGSCRPIQRRMLALDVGYYWRNGVFLTLAPRDAPGQVLYGLKGFVDGYWLFGPAGLPLSYENPLQMIKAIARQIAIGDGTPAFWNRHEIAAFAEGEYEMLCDMGNRTPAVRSIYGGHHGH